MRRLKQYIEWSGVLEYFPSTHFDSLSVDSNRDLKFLYTAILTYIFFPPRNLNPEELERRRQEMMADAKLVLYISL